MLNAIVRVAQRGYKRQKMLYPMYIDGIAIKARRIEKGEGDAVLLQRVLICLFAFHGIRLGCLNRTANYKTFLIY